MKSINLSIALSDIREDYIEEAATYTTRSKFNPWVKWGSLAACLAIFIVVAIISIPPIEDTGDGWIGADKLLPTSIDNIIWNEYTGLSGSTNSDDYKSWKGLLLHYTLYDTLEDVGEAKYLAILIKRVNGEDIKPTEYANFTGPATYIQNQNGNVYIFITKKQFESLLVKDESNYTFHLANLEEYQK